MEDNKKNSTLTCVNFYGR